MVVGLICRSRSVRTPGKKVSSATAQRLATEVGPWWWPVAPRAIYCGHTAVTVFNLHHSRPTSHNACAQVRRYVHQLPSMLNQAGSFPAYEPARPHQASDLPLRYLDPSRSAGIPQDLQRSVEGVVGAVRHFRGGHRWLGGAAEPLSGLRTVFVGEDAASRLRSCGRQNDEPR